MPVKINAGEVPQCSSLAQTTMVQIDAIETAAIVFVRLVLATKENATKLLIMGIDCINMGKEVIFLRVKIMTSFIILHINQ